MELATDTDQQKEKLPLKLETLGVGIANINTGYALSEVIDFIKKLGIKVYVWTNRSEDNLKIIFPTPSFFNAWDIKRLDSIITITGQLKKQEPESRARGRRQVLCPTDYVTQIPAKIKDSRTIPDAIRLSATCSTRNMKSAIRKAIGKVPKNWQFNPR